MPRTETQNQNRQRYSNDHPILSWLLPFFLFNVFFAGAYQEPLASPDDPSLHTPDAAGPETQPEPEPDTTHADAGDANLDTGAVDTSNSFDSFDSGSF